MERLVRRLRPSSQNPQPGKPRYKRLKNNKHQIRVLDVAPCADGGMIECTLRHISLDDDPVPSYETISYCWGPPTDPAVIRLDGRLVYVPATSEAAVRRMRRPNTPRTLWIDAICIDQLSIQEKSIQVAFMSLVYSNGTQNLIYLGEDSDGMAERSLEAVRHMVTEMRGATGDFQKLRETFYGNSNELLYSQVGFDKDPDFEALECLFSLPWFRRLWVLQEAALSRSSLCFWGPARISLLEVLRAAKWIGYKFMYTLNFLKRSPGLDCAMSMFDHADREASFFARARSSLASCFMDSPPFERTEPRDGVYAVLGLVELHDSASERHKGLLAVDYNRPLADVLCDATRFALLQRNDLAALRSVHHRQDYLDTPVDRSFPSWTVRADLLFDRDSDSINLPGVFHACAGLDRPTKLSDTSYGSDVLVLEGFVVDHVADTTAVQTDREWSNWYIWLGSAKQLVSKIQHGQQSDTAEMYNDLVFTITAAISGGGRRARREDLLESADILQHLESSSDMSSNDGAEPGALTEDERNTLNRLILYAHHRKLLITEDGRMGLGPGVMEPQDIIAILKGGRTPFILREVNGGFSFVGQAYVHGIMDGEAVQAFTALRGKPIEFHVK